MKTDALPRVGVIDALATGLVEAARRPWLMTIPLVSELLLWLAPRVSVAELLRRLMQVWEALLRASYSSAQIANMEDMIATVRDTLGKAGASLNLVEGIAGGWIGAPSVLAGVQVTRQTFISDLVLAPAGLSLPLPQVAAAPLRGAAVEITSGWVLLLALVGFWFIGQLLATAYLRWAAQSWRGKPPSVSGGTHARPFKALVTHPWPGVSGFWRLFVRLAVFSILLGVAVMILRLPLAFAVTLSWLSSGTFLAALLLLFGGIALWLTLWFLISLFFAGEAIVLDEQTILQGVLRSIVFVHSYFWPTMAFSFLINLIMYGFRIVWNVLGTSSVGTLVAMAANVYLATGLLLAIFAYYEGLALRAIARRPVKRAAS